MQAVILAAGKGTRFLPLTETTPKPLILLKGKPILDHILDNLPDAILSVIVVTGHLGDKIAAHLSTRENTATVAQQPGPGGTYGALASAREFLTDAFLVLHGDDLYRKDELTNFIKLPRAFGVHTGKLAGYYSIITDGAGNLSGMRPQNETEKMNGAPIATGAYVLDKSFFELAPRQTLNGEYGIPHTLAAHAADYPIKTFEFSFWQAINSAEDINRAEKII